MKSEIRVSTPKIKIYVTIGVTMFLIAVVAMVLYPDAIRAILYSTAAVILMYGGSRGIGWLGGVALKMAHGYQGLRRERLDNDRVQIENDERRLKSKIMIVSRTDGYIRLDTDDYYGPAMVGSAPVVDSTARQLPDGEQRRLMALFAQFIHWLLIGPTQTGKTTLMNHLIDAYEPDAIIYVGDPHSKLNIWSTRAEVVGRGRDFVAVADLIARVWQLMDDRYRGDDLSFDRVVLVVDEWPSVVAGTPTPQETSRYLRELARESAKVNIRLIFGSHGDTVGDLGTEGHAQVKENFVRVKLSHSLRQRNEGVIIDSEDGKEIVTLAGPYYPPGGGRFFSRSQQQQAYRLPPPPEPGPSETKLCALPDCDNPVSDRAKYCSDACRQKAYRDRN